VSDLEVADHDPVQQGREGARRSFRGDEQGGQVNPVAPVLIGPFDTDIAHGRAVDFGQPKVRGKVAVDEVVVERADHRDRDHEEAAGGEAARIGDVGDEMGFLRPADRPEEKPGNGGRGGHDRGRRHGQPTRLSLPVRFA